MNEAFKYKLAIELLIVYPETIEDRCLAFLNFLRSRYKRLICFLDRLDATGKYGIFLSELVEEEEIFEVSIDGLIELFKEDGQVIELNLVVEADDIGLLIQIIDGTHVNIISDSYAIIESEALGSFNYLDIRLFGNVAE